MVGVLLGLSGCGWSEDKFVERFVEADCAFALACMPAAELEFEGWGTQEACVAERGSEVVAQGESCIYDRQAARQCVQELEEQICPAEGTELVLPVICGSVYAVCDESLSDDTGA
jgi:hypothetical protein